MTVIAGFVAVIGVGYVAALIGLARSAVQLRHEPTASRAPGAQPLHSPLNPYAVDATASEFDDLRRPQFTPLVVLTRRQKRTIYAAASRV